MAQLIPIQERTPGEKLSYLQGYRGGILRALDGIERGMNREQILDGMEREVNLVMSTFSPTGEPSND